MNTNTDKAVGLTVLLLFLVLFWDKIKSIFMPSAEDSQNEGKEINAPNGTKINFNMWRKFDFKNLQNNGFTIKLFTQSAIDHIIDSLRNSGIIVYRDSEILDAMRTCRYKTQVNQLVSVFPESVIPIIKPDVNLFDFLKNKLTDDNFESLIQYLNNLPNGYEIKK